MKKQQLSRLLLVFAVLFAGMGTVFFGPTAKVSAEDNPVIVLNDATPSTDVVISANNGASGVIYLEIQDAQVSLLDSTNAIVLNMADARISALAIQFAENSTTHTLHLERMPNVPAARVMVIAQSELPQVTVASGADGSADLAIQGPTAIKATVSPATTVPFSVSDKANMLTAQFAAAPETVQISDDKGGIVLTSFVGTGITGLSVRLKPGNYAMNMVNQDLKSSTDVALALSTAPDLTMPADTTTVAEATPDANTGNAAAVACTAKVNAASVNLRSGPGTAYSVLGFTVRGSELTVGGQSKSGKWLLVQSPVGAAWIVSNTTTLAGNCDGLTVFDTLERNSVQQPPVIIKQPGSNGGTVTNPGSKSSSESEHHEGESEHENESEHDDD